MRVTYTLMDEVHQPGGHVLQYALWVWFRVSESDTIFQYEGLNITIGFLAEL